MKLNYQSFLLSGGYLFFTANRFSCLLNNYLLTSKKVPDQTFYYQLQDKVRSAEKDIVWVAFDKIKDKPKVYNGFSYDEIYPRKFMFFLVKGSKLPNCQSIDEIVIKNMDNVYFPVLLPITWE